MTKPSSSGRRRAVGTDNSRSTSSARRRGVREPARLLEVHEAAAYLGVSPWTVRDLEAAGTIRRVRVPTAGGRELRRLLFDRWELDRLIDAWRAS